MPPRSRIGPTGITAQPEKSGRSTIDTYDAECMMDAALRTDRKLIAQWLRDALPEYEISKIISGEYKNFLVHGILAKGKPHAD